MSKKLISQESRPSQKPGTMTTCGYCSATLTTQLLCGACKLANYCSKICQKKAWSTHKPLCRKIAQVRVEALLIPEKPEVIIDRPIKDQDKFQRMRTSNILARMAETAKCEVIEDLKLNSTPEEVAAQYSLFEMETQLSKDLKHLKEHPPSLNSDYDPDTGRVVMYKNGLQLRVELLQAAIAKRKAADFTPQKKAPAV